MFKKLYLLAALIVATLTVQGCTFPQPFPIENAQNILIAGLDIEGDEVVLTVLVDSIVQSSDPGKEKIEHKLYSATGKTVFEAKRNMDTFAEKRITFYHTRYILVGEQAARQGVDRLIKFFNEDDETNFLHILIIAKGMTAKEYLEQENTQEKKVPDILTTLFDATSKTGYSLQINLIDYAGMRSIPWKSVYIPTVLLCEDPIEQIVDLQKVGDQNQSSQLPPTLSSLEGFGVFDEDKLVGFLNANMARGMLFIISEIGSTAISVQDKKGKNVALEVMQSKAKITPNFADPLSATIEIDVESNLDEYQESKEVLDESYIKYLEKQQSEFIKNEVEQTLSFLKEKQTDVIGMGDAFYHSNPVKWQDIEANWKSVFTDLDIEVKVTSDIQYSYVITNAVGE